MSGISGSTSSVQVEDTAIFQTHLEVLRRDHRLDHASDQVRATPRLDGERGPSRGYVWLGPRRRGEFECRTARRQE
jgi:hypothetical protein